MCHLSVVRLAGAVADCPMSESTPETRLNVARNRKSFHFLPERSARQRSVRNLWMTITLGVNFVIHKKSNLKLSFCFYQFLISYLDLAQ